MVVDGVKVRHGDGRHADGKEVYLGQWQNDAMHGQGGLRERARERAPQPAPHEFFLEEAGRRSHRDPDPRAP